MFVAVKEYPLNKKGESSSVVMIEGIRPDGSHFKIECVPIDMAEYIANCLRKSFDSPEDVTELISMGNMRNTVMALYRLTDEQYKLFPDIRMTVEDYADKVGVTPQAVTERIRRKSYPKGVKYVTNVGRSYLLNVCSEELQ